MIKIFRWSTPSPLYLSVALMICPGVHANSVHSCNAGNVKRLFKSRAGLESVPCLAPWNIPWNICSSADGRQLVFHAMSVEHCLDAHHRLTLCLESTLLVYM
jgi:hypothetical protein